MKDSPLFLARGRSWMGGDAGILLNKVREEIAKLGAKKTVFHVPGIIQIRKRQSQKPGIMTAWASGVIREALFWDEEKRLF